MPYRRLTDIDGTTWRVWDVVPSLIDRRTHVRRVRAVKLHHPERRVLPTRRVDPGRSRLYFPPTETGWLCFESPTERRRLRPIPSTWAAETDATLLELCRRAEPQAVAAR